MGGRGLKSPEKKDHRQNQVVQVGFTTDYNVKWVNLSQRTLSIEGEHTEEETGLLCGNTEARCSSNDISQSPNKSSAPKNEEAQIYWETQQALKEPGQSNC